MEKELAAVSADGVLPARPVLAAATGTEPPIMAARAIYPFGHSRQSMRRAALWWVVTAIVVWFLIQVQSVLPPFLIAFGLAALFDPTIRWIERRGHTRVQAVLFIYLLGLLGMTLFIVLIVPTIKNQVQELSANIGPFYTQLQGSVDDMIARNTSMLRLMGVRQSHISEILAANSGFMQGKAQVVLGGVTAGLGMLVARFPWLIIIPIASFFFLRDYPVLRGRIIWQFPGKYQQEIDTMSREIVDVFSAYIRGLGKICVLYGITSFVLYEALGLQYALIIAVVVGIFYAVPLMGYVITGVATGTVAYTMQGSTALFAIHFGPHSAGYALLVVACAVSVQVIFDQIVYPRVVGGSVGLHPVVSLFALASGATLFGVWGMLLAVPVAASIQIVLTSLFPKLTATPPEDLRVDPAPAA